MLPVANSALRPLTPSDDAPEVTPDSAPDPSALLAGWMADVRTGAVDRPHRLRLADGRLIPLPVARWSGPVDVADESLLVRAGGPVLDVGCGPGRLTAELHRRGVEVLGLELVDAMPVLVREAGAPLLLGDVFGPVPRAGTWHSILLADGNIGIGGDVVRLLRRLRRLLSPTGQLLLELAPGGGTTSGPVRLEGLGEVSAWFPWTLLGTSGMPTAASAAGLAVSETWSVRGRDFASLMRL